VPRAWLIALGVYLSFALLPSLTATAAEPIVQVRFVREGLLLEPGLAASARESLRVNGMPQPASAAPGGGTLVARTWRPREIVRLEWRGVAGAQQRELRAPLRPEPWVVATLPWEGPDERGTISSLAFSQDGAWLAVGSLDGQAAIFALPSPRPVWTLRRAGRAIKQVLFDPHAGGGAARLIVGEQGPEGRVAAYRWRAGHEPEWSFDTAVELGTSQPADPDGPYGWVTYPGLYRMLWAGDALVAAFTHSWPGEQGRLARGRLYALNPERGTLRWAFPAEGPLERIFTWADAAGGLLALPVQLPLGAALPLPPDAESALVVLDGATGRVDFRVRVPARPPRRFAGIWRGVAFSPGGAHLALSTEDGRALLFDRAEAGWRPRRELELVRPLELAGAIVTATNGTLAATARGPLFLTGRTYIPSEYRRPGQEPLAEHPQGNTLFARDWAGEPLWQWRLDADLMGLAVEADAGLLALAEGHVEDPARGGFEGLALLDLRGDAAQPVLFRVPVQGRAPYDGVALSPGGAWIALAEAPLRNTLTAERRGAHRIHLLR
jgi:outer membrane protein assembly factor BamB